MANEHDTGGFSTAKENIIWRLSQLEEWKKEQLEVNRLMDDKIDKQAIDQAVTRTRLVTYTAVGSAIINWLLSRFSGGTP